MSIATMPVTRSSVLNAKDLDAAHTLLRFHYDMKAFATAAAAATASKAPPAHTMSLRGRKMSSSSRPKRNCAVYTPGMYAEEV